MEVTKESDEMLKERVEAIYTAQLLVEKAKAEIAVKSAELAELFDGGYVPTQEEIDYLYWDAKIPITNSAKNYVSGKTATPKVVVRECCRCNNVFPFVAKSKTSLANLQSEHCCELCDNCKEEQKIHQIKINAMMQAEYDRKQRMIASSNGDDLINMPYRLYLKTRYWLDFRKQVKEHYNHTCAKCGSVGNTDAHHVTYDNKGNETFEDIVLLCRSCHDELHWYMKGDSMKVMQFMNTAIHNRDSTK